MRPRGYSTITGAKGSFQEWGTERNVRNTPFKLPSCLVSTSEYLKWFGRMHPYTPGPF